MEMITAQLLTDQGNNAVLKLPTRKYPGVLVQGDTLSTWISFTQEALDALERSSVDDALNVVQLLREKMTEAQGRYEAALRAHGIELPYR